MDEFQLCIDVAKIDHVLGNGTGGLAYNATNGTSLSVYSSLYDPSCDYPTPVLPQVVFMCSNIPQCLLECNPNNGSENMDFAVFDASCKASLSLVLFNVSATELTQLQNGAGGGVVPCRRVWLVYFGSGVHPAQR